MKAVQIKNHTEKWMEKKIHGKYFQNVKKEGTVNNLWLTKGVLKVETEALPRVFAKTKLYQSYRRPHHN